jgi:hypothetical protein
MMRTCITNQPQANVQPDNVLHVLRVAAVWAPAAKTPEWLISVVCLRLSACQKTPATALMTTAYQTTRTGNSGQEFGDPFDFGAGHIDPVKALNPGLLFDSKFNDWRLFLCGVERRPEDRWCRCVITYVTHVI